MERVRRVELPTLCLASIEGKKREIKPSSCSRAYLGLIAGVLTLPVSDRPSPVFPRVPPKQPKKVQRCTSSYNAACT